MADVKKDHAKRLRYALIALVFVGTALNYVDRQALALLKPTLEAEFNWSDQEFAHLGSAFQLTAAASVLFVGWLVDRFGVRAAYGGAVAIWSLAGIAHAFAATVGQFLAARIVLAAAESINTPAALKAATQYLPARPLSATQIRSRQSCAPIKRLESTPSSSPAIRTQMSATCSPAMFSQSWNMANSQSAKSRRRHVR